MTVGYMNWRGMLYVNKERRELERRERYLFRKYQHCKALIAEKRAIALRMEAEADALLDRQERLGKQWAAAKRELHGKKDVV
jgi:hypothetical protein